MSSEDIKFIVELFESGKTINYQDGYTQGNIVEIEDAFATIMDYIDDDTFTVDLRHKYVTLNSFSWF